MPLGWNNHLFFSDFFFFFFFFFWKYSKKYYCRRPKLLPSHHPPIRWNWTLEQNWHCRPGLIFSSSSSSFSWFFFLFSCFCCHSYIHFLLYSICWKILFFLLFNGQQCDGCHEKKLKTTITVASVIFKNLDKKKTIEWKSKVYYISELNIIYICSTLSILSLYLCYYFWISFWLVDLLFHQKYSLFPAFFFWIFGFFLVFLTKLFFEFCLFSFFFLYLTSLVALLEKKKKKNWLDSFEYFAICDVIVVALVWHMIGLPVNKFIHLKILLFIQMIINYS